MILPNFIIFGAIKSGTGALYQYLSHHPDIFMSPLKEPRYFARVETTNDLPSKNRKKHIGVSTLDEYSNLFSRVKHEKAIGEASSNYIYSKHAAEKIKNTIPDVKLIVSLRNPVDRAWAHYQMMNRYRSKGLNIMLKDCKHEKWATASLYTKHLQVYFNLFGKNKIKVLIFEEWVENTEKYLNEIYRFLNVSPNFCLSKNVYYQAAVPAWKWLSPESQLRKVKRFVPTAMLMKINRVKHALTFKNPELNSDSRSEMYNWYKEDIKNLQILLQRDLSVWKK